MSEPPPGWAIASIGDVIGPIGVFADGDWVETKDQDPAGEVRLIQLADVGDGFFRNRSNRFLTDVRAHELGCTFLRSGDVLIARMPDPLGRACVFPGVGQPSVTAVDVCIVRPGSDAVDARWLMWAINAPQFRARVSSLQSGTTRKRISRKNLSTIELPVPPLTEQRRIVVAIEEQLSRLDAADASLKTGLRRLAVLEPAQLAAITDGWPMTSLGDVVGSMRYGTSAKCGYEADGPPVLRIPNVQGGRIDTSDLKFATVSASDLGDCFVDESDLLFVRTNGSRNLIGRVAAVGRLEPPTGFASYLIRARPIADVLDPRWAVIAFSTPRARAEIESRAATTAGQYNLNLVSLRSLSLPLPPIDEQRRLVDEVEAQLSLIDAMRKEIETAKRRSTGLRRAILDRAFRGELVPQDPSDEPASVLLDRIRAERAAAPPSRRVSRRRSTIATEQS